MFNLMPRDETFFDLLEQLAGHTVAAVQQLQKLTQSFPNIAGPVEQIEKEEQAADDVTQSELKKLDSAFITPLDREDILHLMTDQYKVVETVADIAQRFKRYKLTTLDPEFAQQVGKLQSVTDCLNTIVSQLRKGHKLSEMDENLQKMHRLKKEAKGDLNAYLEKLFGEKSEPLDIFKRKELHDLIGQALNDCETVTRTLQRVILKNS